MQNYLTRECGDWQIRSFPPSHLSNLYQLRQRVNSTTPNTTTAAQNVISEIAHVSNLYPKKRLRSSFILNLFSRMTCTSKLKPYYIQSFQMRGAIQSVKKKPSTQFCTAPALLKLPAFWRCRLKADALKCVFYFPLDSAGTSPERRPDWAKAVSQLNLHLNQRFI